MRTDTARRVDLRVAATLVVAVVVLSSLASLHGASHRGTPLGSDPTVPTSGRPSTAPVAVAESVPVASPQAALGPLSVAGISPTAVALAWSSSPTWFSNYVISYSTNGSGGPFSTYATDTSQTPTAYIATALTPGASYSWYVTMNQYVFGSSTSNVVSETQSILANLTSSYVTASDVRFNWTNSATYGGGVSFSSYDLFESVGGGRPTDVASLTSNSSLTATVSGLASGSSYEFYLNTTDCVGGCGTSTPTLVTTRSNTITLGTPLPLSVSVVAERSTIDAGERDLLTCTPAGGSSPFAYSWNLGNGTYENGSWTRSVSFALAGTDMVTCRVIDHTPTTVLGSVSLFVNLDPTLKVSLNRTTADIDQAVSYSCTPSNGTSPYSVEWMFGDGGATAGELAQHTYTAAGPESASCVVSDSTATQVVVTESILVSPVLSTGIGSSTAAAAPGTTIAFAAAPAEGSGLYTSYHWSFGDGTGTTTTAADVTHSYSTPGIETATVTVQDSNNATSTATDSVVISAISISAFTVPGSAHTGDMGTFSANATGGAGGPYTFSWSFGDGHTASGPSVTHAYTTAGSYAPKLVVTDRLGASVNRSASAISVSAPPPPPPLLSPLLLLLLAILIGIVAAIGYELRRRQSRDKMFPALAGRIPAVGSAGTLKGRKICRVCGTSNLPIRETCDACGASLRGPILP